MVELCEALVIRAGEIVVEAMVDVGGDGDAVAALLDVCRRLLDAGPLRRTGRRDDGDAAAGR